MLKTEHRIWLIFILVYIFTYMCSAIYGTYIPVYLSGIGYNKTSIGVLLSLAPIIAIAVQPLWGILGDRSKSKNTILNILILGSAISILLFKVSTSFIFLSLAVTLFTFFSTAINPMSDAITLEYSYIKKWKFGYVRLAGTLGFALMSILSGMLLAKGISRMFYIYFLLGIVSLILALFLPKVKGHQTKAKRVPMWSLLRDKKLLLLITFAFIIQITISYFGTFFGIYYVQIGANKKLLGIAFFISSFSEVPFLLFSHKILKKVKPQHAIIFAGIACSFRWLILGTVSNIYIILVSQALHGLGFIIIMVTLAIYINDHAPQELKASGQALIGIVNAGAAKIIASLGGGYLSDMFGIKQMFINNSILVVIAVIVFGIIFYKRDKSLSSLTG